MLIRKVVVVVLEKKNVNVSGILRAAALWNIMISLLAKTKNNLLYLKILGC